MDDKIKDAFLKTATYLAKTQKEDGNWSVKKLLYNEPPIYLKDSIITAQCTKTLIMLSNSMFIDNIKRGLYFCASTEPEEFDKIELWIWKLFMLKFINSPNYKKEKENVIKYICEQQKNGHWESYPTTFNLTNFNAVMALQGTGCRKELTAAIDWFKKNKAKDRIGWGIDDKTEESILTFSLNIVLALIAAGEDPTVSYIQKLKDYIEKSQKKDGSWLSTISVKKPTTYATALATVALMLTSKDPFNERVKKGLDWLVSKMSNGGGWPLVPGEPVKIYTTYYTVYALRFYDYLKEKWESEETNLLKKNLKPQQVSAILFQNFDNYLIEKFKKLVLNNVLYSKALGSTSRAIERRRDILNTLSGKKELDIAGIIDELKKDPKYSYLNKKHYITQIKFDVDCLRGIKLIDRIHDLYFVVVDLFS
jgi:hypothetical protein